MPPRKPETEDEAERIPLQPWEIAELREDRKRRRQRAWLLGVVWKTLAWATAFFAVLSGFKDQILSWFGRGSP